MSSSNPSLSSSPWSSVWMKSSPSSLGARGEVLLGDEVLFGASTATAAMAPGIGCLGWDGDMTSAEAGRWAFGSVDLGLYVSAEAGRWPAGFGGSAFGLVSCFTRTMGVWLPGPQVCRQKRPNSIGAFFGAEWDLVGPDWPLASPSPGRPPSLTTFSMVRISSVTFSFCCARWSVRATKLATESGFGHFLERILDQTSSVRGRPEAGGAKSAGHRTTTSKAPWRG
mmetsp:Transcript_28979/g.76600  ORF Transcript_28979/g.76600 Transcript_28979/m.76600 type:complete len:225 (+) Transcript_28979:538-1212(+)